LYGDALRVEYNLITSMDFVDGVYIRAPGTP
jgi:hypothetical protein